MIDLIGASSRTNLDQMDLWIWLERLNMARRLSLLLGLGWSKPVRLLSADTTHAHVAIWPTRRRWLLSSQLKTIHQSINSINIESIWLAVHPPPLFDPGFVYLFRGRCSSRCWNPPMESRLQGQQQQLPRAHVCGGDLPVGGDAYLQPAPTAPPSLRSTQPLCDPVGATGAAQRAGRPPESVQAAIWKH